MADVSSVELSAAQSSRLAATVLSHGWYQLAPFEWDERSGTLRRQEQLGNAVVDITVSQPSDGRVRLEVESPEPLGPDRHQELVERVRWMLGLDEDLGEFYDVCRADPRLAHVVQEYRGRLLRGSSVFEDAVKLICTTNTTWPQTRGMVDRLVSTLGTPSAVSHRNAFPSAVSIAEAGREVLRDQVRLGYRAPYIAELAERVTAGELDLESLPRATEPSEEIRRRLLQIKGVGPYAAASLLCLIGRYDYIGVDSWARKLVSTEFYAGASVTDRQVEETFAPYGRWRALAFWFYAWRET
jgi:3-methyladenine DNA glycosylase/8-oxoguanine DNA glycosylase